MIEIRSGTVCPCCGFTEEVFAEAFKLGCSLCYETFAPQIETMLPKLHSGVVHTGKVPTRTPDPSIALQRELIEIESLLFSGDGDAPRRDELLDRWKEVSDELSHTTMNPKSP